MRYIQEIKIQRESKKKRKKKTTTLKSTKYLLIRQKRREKIESMTNYIAIYHERIIYIYVIEIK